MGKSEDKKSYSWKEQAAFVSMIDDLTTSSSKIKKATRFCIKHQKWYKHIVQIIEKFALKEKSKNRQKLQIIYIIDGILRQLQRDKKEKALKKFSSRFDRNIVTTVKNLVTVSLAKEKPKMKRVIDLWAKQKRVFSEVNIISLRELVRDFPKIGEQSVPRETRAKSITSSPLKNSKSPTDMNEELPLPDQDETATPAGGFSEEPSPPSSKKSLGKAESLTQKPVAKEQILDYSDVTSLEKIKQNLKRKPEQSNTTPSPKKAKIDNSEETRSKSKPKSKSNPKTSEQDSFQAETCESPKFTKPKKLRPVPTISEPRPSLTGIRSKSGIKIPRPIPPPVRLRSPPPIRLRSPPPFRLRSPPPISLRPFPPARIQTPSPARMLTPPPDSMRTPPPTMSRSPTPVRDGTASPDWEESASSAAAPPPAAVSSSASASPSASASSSDDDSDENTPLEPVRKHPGYVIKEDDPSGSTGLSTCIWTQFIEGEGDFLKTHCAQLGDLVDFHIVKEGQPSEAFISFKTRSAALTVKMNLLKGSLSTGSSKLPQLIKVGWGKTPGLVDFDFSNGIGKLCSRT